MGRPLNKKYLGNPDKPGEQIVFSACWFAGQPAPSTDVCYVKRQIGTGRFQAEEKTTGLTGHVKLIGSHEPVAGPDMTALNPGEARLDVQPFGPPGTPHEHARVIYNRSVKTWQDHQYRWSLVMAAQPGDANLPMA